MVGQLADDSLALIKDSQTMDEATVNILDDPMALSFVLKKQYEDVLNKNSKLRHTEKNGLNWVRNLELEAQQSIGESLEGQGYTIDAEELEESKVAEAEQSQGADAILWPSQQ